MAQKKTNTRFRIGNALLKEGLINEKQLELALSYQEMERKRMKGREIAPLGEVIVHLFNISLDKIEEVFFREYLIHVIRDALLDLILRDRLCTKDGMDFEAILDDIHIRLISYQRLKAESVFLKEEEGRIIFDYSECWDYKIQGSTEATIQAKDGQTIKSPVNFIYIINKKIMALAGDLGTMRLRGKLKKMYLKFQEDTSG
ncbi:MAG: hypothetical protein KBA28_10345 [Syntrophaceae bacterium]|jgi:hypothetical protein|nr:hypothetical protein [Syntrophaceae bacterium]HOC60527.1 hypothetical protein [Smithellaceae bacterium]HQM46388.1 hypothetical protein [Smithellaceae bacterium]